MNRHDVAVIGGGAAGLSAALVLSRALRKVVVVDAGTPRNAPASHMHGYLSRDGLPPGELLASGRNEVKSYGGEIVAGTALDLTADGPSGFCVLLENGQRISGAAAAGRDRATGRAAGHPGLQERWARDVLHCRTATDTRFATASSASSVGTGRRPVRADRPPVEPRRRLLHPT